MVTRSATRPQIKMVQAQEVGRVRRRLRKPQIDFNIRSKPFQIVPFAIMPTLPGETLESIIWRSDAVSDPIHNRHIGWWKETYWFWISHRGLSAWDTTGLLQTMMLTAGTDVSTLKAAANDTDYYTYKGGMDFVKQAVTAIVKEYFRDEDEEANAATIGNYFAAQVDNKKWFQNLKKESDTGDDSELPGVDELEELDVIPGFTTEYAQWEIMRDEGMTDLTYEDYLRSYGVSIPKSEDEGGTPDERHRPEVIRQVRKWAKPVNAVDATDGSVASAVRWSVAERASKDRYWKEPGFIVGLTVHKPKLYLGNQKGSAVGFLDDAYAWLPKMLEGCPYTSVDEIVDSATDGIFQNQNEDYWFDKKDLFLHGDQFVNWTLSAANNHGLALPVTNTLVHRYVTEALVDSLFVADPAEYIYEDGTAFFNIRSFVRETT